MSGEDWIPVTNQPRTVSSPGGKGEVALWGPFYTGTHRAGPPLMTSPPPDTITLGIRSQHRLVARTHTLGPEQTSDPDAFLLFEPCARPASRAS